MEVEVKLYDGVTIGERTIYDLVMRPPTAGDLLDAQESAERPVATPQGWQLLASDSRMGTEVLRRQIKRIGDDSGPMELSTLRQLSAHDLGLLQIHADQIDRAIAQEMANRGRADGAGGGDADG